MTMTMTFDMRYSSTRENHHLRKTIVFRTRPRLRTENVIMMCLRLFTLSHIAVLVFPSPVDVILQHARNEELGRNKQKKNHLRNGITTALRKSRPKYAIRVTQNSSYIEQPRQLDSVWCNDDGENDDGCQYYINDDFINSTAYYEEYAQTTLWDMFETPPHDWTATQWGFFSALMTIFAFLSCCFCCTWLTQFCGCCIRCYANCI